MKSPHILPLMGCQLFVLILAVIAPLLFIVSVMPLEAQEKAPTAKENEENEKFPKKAGIRPDPKNASRHQNGDSGGDGLTRQGAVEPSTPSLPVFVDGLSILSTDRISRLGTERLEIGIGNHEGAKATVFIEKDMSVEDDGTRTLGWSVEVPLSTIAKSPNLEAPIRTITKVPNTVVKTTKKVIGVGKHVGTFLVRGGKFLAKGAKKILWHW